MSAMERAAVVARIEQHLEGGADWDRVFAKIVDDVCDPALLAVLLADRDMYAELELMVFDQLAGELEAV